jgi:hypothetical protein
MSAFFFPQYRRTPNRKKRGPGNILKKLRSRLTVEQLEDRFLPSCNVISGYVFNDANNNGLRDPGEVGLANSAIELHNASGTVIGTAVTDASGFYQFSTDSSISTAPTTLTHAASIPLTATDWTQAVNVQQFDPSLGTLTSVDIINAGTFVSRIQVESLDSAPSTITGTVSGTLTLSGSGIFGLMTNGSFLETFNASAFDGIIDFGGTSGHDFGPQTASGAQTAFVTAPADLAAYVGTGNISFTEVAHATSSASGAGNLVTHINSSASGSVSVIYHYIPSNCLRPGSYTIVQTSEPAGYLDGKESSNGAVIPNSTGAHSIQVTLTNTDSTENDFGELLPSGLSGFVYFDANNDGVMELGEPGLAGAAVTLTGTNDLGAAIQVSQTTGPDGAYHFANLRPGNYTVSQGQPGGYLDGKDSLGSAGGQVGNDQFSAIALPSDVSGVSYNFGELLPSTISGLVYLDVNNDGIREVTEPGISAVTITLTGTDDLGNSVLVSQLTGSDGAYRFTGLRPGTYSVTETPPANYLDGKDSLGSAGGTVSTDRFSNIPLTTDVSAVNYNFGELLPSSLSGFVYLDRNNNGVFDPGESGIAGVTVTLIGTNDLGQAMTTAQQTGADGSYMFAGLRPGSYTITKTPPLAYLEGHLNLGSAGGMVGTDQFSQIMLPMGIAGVRYDFGELLPPSPTGVVYSDFGSLGTAQPPDITLILSKLQILNFSSGNLDPATKANAFFVDALYRNLLGRPSDAGGLVNFVLALASGTSRLQVAQIIWQSAEHRGIEVDHLYQTFLHRSADPAGRAAFVQEMVNGASETDVARQLILSSEYQSTRADNATFVASLYADVLGRTASGSELAAWTQALQNGMTRAAAADVFLNSAEVNRHIVDSFYNNFLQRAPDALGEQNFVNALTSHQLTMETAGELILASDEYYGISVRLSQSV